jgi:hypothetical protein
VYYRTTVYWKKQGDKRNIEQATYTVDAITEDEAKYLGGERWLKENKQHLATLGGLKVQTTPLIGRRKSA